MKYVWSMIILLLLCFSCSENIEGLLGAWEGKYENIGQSGNLVESEVTCNISALSGQNRRMVLKVAGIQYDFEAVEQMDVLTFKDFPLEKDSSIRSYISGDATLLYDTLLRFEYEVYTMKDEFVLGSTDYNFDLVRE